MDKLKKKLSEEYRAGRRWLAYDIIKSAGWVGRLRCFADYSEAADWCKAKSAKEGVFRIKVLAEVLAGLNGVRPAGYTDVERQILCDLVSRRPIASYKKSIPPGVGLLRWRYFPVLWNAVVDPLTAVETYQIIGRRECEPGKVKVRVLSSYSELGMAFLDLQRRIDEVKKIDEEWLLVGLLTGNACPATPDLAPAGGVIVFFRSAAPLGQETVEGIPDIVQVNDPTEAVMVQVPYFARYERQHGRINFFDGGLRRVKPGMDSWRLDLEYFDFDWRDIVGEL
jgi:hypothetical protein